MPPLGDAIERYALAVTEGLSAVDAENQRRRESDVESMIGCVA